MIPKDFILISHRGFSSKAPENTIAAFGLALKSNYPHIELDVQLTSDGFPVIIHDDTVDRTTNGSGKVKELSLEAIKKLDAGSWFSPIYTGERIPTLDETLQQFSDKAHMEIELKSDEQELPKVVFAELQKTELLDTTNKEAFEVPSLTIISFSIDQLERSLKLMPNVKHGYLVEDVDDNSIARAKKANVDQLLPRAKYANTQSIQKAHQAGLFVRCWGLERPEEVMRLYKIGVRGATINWPDLAEQALQAI